MLSFTYQALPTRVVFGRGTVERLADEIQALGCRRVALLTTPGQRRLAEQVAPLLGECVGGTWAEAVMHTPVAVTEAVLGQLSGIDGLVALGGGSAIGLAKALALRTGLPQLVVPTTYAGSEATPILGETRDGRKTTQRTLAVLPEVVLYDVDLTLGLPVEVSAASGLNAIAHAAEALYARDGNPLIALLAEDGIRQLAQALPAIVADPQDLAARSAALYGAWACGTCLGAVGMSLHHKLCHVLGGSFDLPHATTHAIVLPHALAYNAAAAPEAMRRIAAVLGTQDAPAGLHTLLQRLFLPTGLRQLGLREGDLDRAVAEACAQPYWNPRAIEAAPLRRLLQRAWTGEAPVHD
jgi:alcohol dehydrogenase class IV